MCFLWVHASRQLYCQSVRGCRLLCCLWGLASRELYLPGCLPQLLRKLLQPCLRCRLRQLWLGLRLQYSPYFLPGL